MARLRAPWVPLLNAVAAPVVRIRSTAAFVAGIESRSVARIGIREPVDDAYRVETAVLVDAFRAVDSLSPLGVLGLRDELTRRWATRLWINRFLLRHPEVGAEPVTAPIVVLGLPRTGTTLLHRLLADRSGMRGPLLWELLAPRPASDPDGDAARRRQAAERMTRLARRAAPAMQVSHDLAADRPEENLFALPHHLAWYTRAPLPGYRKWYVERDATPDYAYLRQQLQVMQWGEPPRRWVLKTPIHLWKMDALLAVFPDATIVWTHRDPARVVPSWCSLTESVRLLNLTRVDPAGLGPEYCEFWSDAIRRALAVRAGLPPDRVVDVGYADLVADPDRVVTRVLTAAGAPATATAAPRPAPEPTRLVHHYRGDRFGLTEAGVREAFAPYLATHPQTLRTG
ncbi:sulfotransferase [Actinoplanes sp. NPDC051633]|uniref:sulfotransferase family protein n=1 Tax=Actinoplanes sp. NPDC051633 TaxID=3155670 RepID=UPI0034462619